jgi:hypothetical protein
MTYCLTSVSHHFSPLLQVSERAEGGMERNDVLRQYNYPAMTKTQSRDGSTFKLHVEAGEFTDSVISVLLGTLNLLS